MRSMLKRDTDADADARVANPDAEAEAEAARSLLQEITEDARKLESRYAKDTAVPGGGE